MFDLVVQAHEALEHDDVDEAGKPGDRLSYDEQDLSDEPRRHRRTSALMRDSLSVVTGDSQHGAGQGGSSSQSPVKRPENLE